MARYSVHDAGVAKARALIAARQYVLDSDWGDVQPGAAAENAFLERHTWEEYAAWHLGLTEGANDGTKARYAFGYGDLRRVHRSGLIACVYRRPSGGTSRSSSPPTGCCRSSTGWRGSSSAHRSGADLGKRRTCPVGYGRVGRGVPEESVRREFLGAIYGDDDGDIRPRPGDVFRRARTCHSR